MLGRKAHWSEGDGSKVFLPPNLNPGRCGCSGSHASLIVLWWVFCLFVSPEVLLAFHGSQWLQKPFCRNLLVFPSGVTFCPKCDPFSVLVAHQQLHCVFVVVTQLLWPCCTTSSRKSSLITSLNICSLWCLFRELALSAL